MALFGVLASRGVAQLQPGDLFREYLWTNGGDDAGGALRVGGRAGYGGGPIPLPHPFDLKHALRAEIVIEKLLCHDGTRGLALSVELCKPYDVPKKWVTRTGEHSEKFRIAGNPQQMVAAQLAWVSWSPGYMQGLSINGQQVFEREGPRYAYYSHRVPLQNLRVLRVGENILTTALTPKVDGKMVHGMEVNWPGIMMLIQYETSP